MMIQYHQGLMLFPIMFEADLFIQQVSTSLLKIFNFLLPTLGAMTVTGY